jgi:predicted naringenin-chalcone synthase
LAEAYINRVATAVPAYEVHDTFRTFALSRFADDRRRGAIFKRMAALSGIERRYSVLAPEGTGANDAINAHQFYRSGAYPDTAARMRAFEQYSPALAQVAVDKLELGDDRDRITHLLITCCTGFSAPGLDFEIIRRCKLPTSIERTMIGFMGCYAAINALKLARHIVRSEPGSRVLVLNLELCTLHLQDTKEIEQMLSFLLFGDGCAAAIVTSEPSGIALDRFRAVVVPDTGDMITWNIGDFGFDMVLSGQVPSTIHDALRLSVGEILDGGDVSTIDLWAVHPGGRTVLDAVERAFVLAPEALAASRDILRRYGNMSSSTVMFVLESMLRRAVNGAKGCAMAFGPGLTAETMLFRTAV